MNIAIVSLLLVGMCSAASMYSMETETQTVSCDNESSFKITFLNEHKQNVFIVEKTNNIIDFVNEAKSLAQIVIDDQRADVKTKQNAEKILENTCNVTQQIQSHRILIFPKNNQSQEICNCCLYQRDSIAHDNSYYLPKQQGSSAENILALLHAHELIEGIKKSKSSNSGYDDLSDKVVQIKELTNIVLQDKKESTENKEKAANIVKVLYSIAPEESQILIKKTNENLKGVHKLMNSLDKRIVEAALILARYDVYSDANNSDVEYDFSEGSKIIKKLIEKIVVDKKATDAIRDEAKQILKRVRQIEAQKNERIRIARREERGSYEK